MKAVIQGFLQRIGLYQRVKSSFLYDLYWKCFRPRIIQERRAEVEFFRQVLTGFRPNDLIFDVGANMGQKTDVFLRLGARVVAVDPDQSNQQILRQRFLDWRWHPKPVSIVGKAVSASNGKQTFWVDKPGSAKNTLNTKWVETLRTDSSRFGVSLEFADKCEVETVTLDSLIETHGLPIFIKIDVEGHEPAVLKGLHRRVGGISFEVNLPEFKPEAIECVNLLGGLDPRGRFNFTPDCQTGLVSREWLSRESFLTALDSCRQPCIEVFWKSQSA